MNIKSSISEFFKTEELKDNLIKFGEAKFELKKLELIGKLEKVMGKWLVQILIGLFFFMIFIFLNVLIGSVINHFTQSFWIGYVVIIVFYALLFLLFHFNKPKVSRFIQNRISDIISKEDL